MTRTRFAAFQDATTAVGALWDRREPRAVRGIRTSLIALPLSEALEQAFQSGHPLTQVGDIVLQIANSDPVSRDRCFNRPLTVLDQTA